MKKLQIKLVLFFSIFLLISCSYEPIFSQKNYNFKLDKITFSGEKNVNKIVENQLDLFKRAESSKKKITLPQSEENKKTYSIDINSKLNRDVVSKDAKGDPQKFEKIIIVDLRVFYNSKVILDKELEGKYVYNNDSDKFKLEQTEKIIIENLSQNITNSIISSIINIDDN